MDRMDVTVRLFAFQAQHAGARVTLSVPAGATVGEAMAVLRERWPTLPWAAGTMTAVNMEYVAAGHRLAAGDELAIIPPVSGGCEEGRDGGTVAGRRT